MSRIRRFYNAQAHAEPELAQVWRAKQQERGGTPLPAVFPHRILLIERGYSTLDDLQGATEAELFRAGLNQLQARAVLAAIA